MSMPEQPIDGIEEAPFRGLVNNQVSGGRDVGFKFELPDGGNGTALEFLADVTDFGNV